ncbi:hypothetical protein MTO96_001030 [Rhipicephalus appendiculatus]
MKSPKGEAALGNSEWSAQALCWLARARLCVIVYSLARCNSAAWGSMRAHSWRDAVARRPCPVGRRHTLLLGANAAGGSDRRAGAAARAAGDTPNPLLSRA